MSTDFETRTINKTANIVLAVSCNKCKHSTKHDVLASVDINGQATQYEIQYWSHYQIIFCRGCETVSFRIATGNSEDFEPIDNTIEYIESVTLFPSRDEGRLPIKDKHLLPSNIQRIYDETVKAINNDQPVLTGIGIRALIETICKDKQATGKYMVERIDSLVALGVLTKDGAVILHKIRSLGNEAAHEVKPHKSKQLGLAMDVCEHLLQGVYVLPYHAGATFQ